ncbi:MULTISPECIES: CRISPR-associated endoribonuclease Cas6 [Clostridium]|uniref:CRISPR-associated endoribonuclease Cas6 n=1 Tax=Clostridium TaxID=1485 RepID=UPI00241FE6B6|nr:MULTISPECIES: CRISPR-associated endoribonuclease Cas6 [Clostridium]MDU3523759.1 CRISPR-associated endoribonuclease Cas6 [Clostridium sp.]MDU4738151.1 CRISPR-associated endoribonuclease Cas6 [Clostridium sp.]
MKVYQIRVKVYLLQNINIIDTQTEIAKFIDGAMAKDERFLDLHQRNEFKNYCFDSFYPTENDKVYKSGGIYTFTLRTAKGDLANFLTKSLANYFNNSIKGLTTEVKIVPKKFIEKIYTLTPIIIKTESGYWKGNLSIDGFEKRIRENLIKKYNEINNTKIEEDFELYNSIEFKNKKPVSVNYKNIKLLGDKISINISSNPVAQELAYLSLGTGVGEMNSRGLGYVNYRYL